MQVSGVVHSTALKISIRTPVCFHNSVPECSCRIKRRKWGPRRETGWLALALLESHTELAVTFIKQEQEESNKELLEVKAILADMIHPSGRPGNIKLRELPKRKTVS